MIAEIVDIRRFPREASLACYSGLGMREHSTGETLRMVRSQLFNHRLKDTFMTAARNVVLYDPDSHLAGYHRNLVKAGMSSMEATKRAARALVRVIYRKLLTLIKEENTEATAQDAAEKGEGDMASGSLRSDQSHTSDISPSPPLTSKAKATKNVKRRTGTVAQASRNSLRG